MCYRALMKNYEFLVFITHILNATTIQPFLSVFSVLSACGDPGKPDNAIIVSQSNNYWTGQYVRYLCNPGYAMVGPAVRRCLVSGKWSGNVPTCKSQVVKKVWQRMLPKGLNRQFQRSRNSHFQNEAKSKMFHLRWLDWIFWGLYLPSLSINYVGMSKDIEKRLPQLYYIKTKISYDLGFIAIGVAMAT